MGQGKKLQELLRLKKIKTKNLAESISVAPTTLYSIIKRDNDIKDSLKDIIAKQIQVNKTAFKYYLNDEITMEQLLSIDPDTEISYRHFDDHTSLVAESSVDYMYNLNERLMIIFEKFNTKGKQEAIKRLEELAYLEKYIKKD